MPVAKEGVWAFSPSDKIAPAMNSTCYVDTASAPTRATTDQGYNESVSGHGQDLPDFLLDQCSMHSNGEQGVGMASIQKPPNEVESVFKCGSLNYCRNRKVRSHSSSYLNKRILEDPLLYSSGKSILPLARDVDAGLGTRNMNWVKSVRSGWWPAKCFEGRNTDRLEEFKDDASEPALCKYENGSLKLSQNGCSGEMQIPPKHDKSDASKTSVSGNSKDEEEGRGKRKRKTKIHFDEMAIRDNPVRKLRRLKIMRLLGLAAPVGSPFSHTHRSS